MAEENDDGDGGGKKTPEDREKTLERMKGLLREQGRGRGQSRSNLAARRRQ